jgi:CVNH domain
MKTITTTKTTSNLKQFYTRMTAAIGLTLLTATIASPAFARDPSSYQNSCKDISLKSNVLSATCRTRDGRQEKRTSVVLRGINNRDGRLVDDGGNAPASFQNSCFATKATGDDLLANCFKINRKDAVFNQIKIQGIRNDNGSLKY